MYPIPCQFVVVVRGSTKMPFYNKQLLFFYFLVLSNRVKDSNIKTIGRVFRLLYI